MGGTLGGQIGTGATGHQVLAENGLKINSDLPFFFLFDILFFGLFEQVSYFVESTPFLY